MAETDEPAANEAEKSTAEPPAPGAKVMPEEDKAAGIDFLDFLFTAAVGFGLTPELLQVSGISGLLSEKWQGEGRWPNQDEWFNIGVFVLGFLNLTLSWFGYHASIKSRKLNYTSGYGMARFVLDVLLVIIYGIILIKYRSFWVVLLGLILVFIIFVIWDCLKIGEYWSKEFRAKYSEGNILKGFRREWVSLFWCVVFIGLGIFYLKFSAVNQWFVLITVFSHDLHALPATRYLVLIGASLATILYRVNKIFPMWERLLKNGPWE